MKDLPADIGGEIGSEKCGGDGDVLRG